MTGEYGRVLALRAMGSDAGSFLGFRYRTYDAPKDYTISATGTWECGWARVLVEVHRIWVVPSVSQVFGLHQRFLAYP